MIRDRILNFINLYYEKNKKGCRLVDIAKDQNKSISTIFFHLQKLEEKGLIKREYGNIIPNKIKLDKNYLIKVYVKKGRLKELLLTQDLKQAIVKKITIPAWFFNNETFLEIEFKELKVK